MASILSSLLPALVPVLLAAPPRVDFPSETESATEMAPASLLSRLAAAKGDHLADCPAEGVRWLVRDLGGPAGNETVLVTFRDGVAIFGARGELLARVLDKRLRCGEAAGVRQLAVVQLRNAPLALLVVLRDDTGKGRETEEIARLYVFNGKRLALAWEARFHDDDRFDGSRLRWNRRLRKFVER